MFFKRYDEDFIQKQNLYLIVNRLVIIHQDFQSFKQKCTNILNRNKCIQNYIFIYQSIVYSFIVNIEE